MDKKLTTTRSTKIKIKEDLIIDRKHTTEIINDAGIRMLKYKYQLVMTKNGRYKIGDPQEYLRIAKALNSPNVRFIKINNDLVNISTIEVLKEQVGYISLKELEEKK